MLQNEFETLIGKEVSYDTFKMYESMYMVLPNDIDKEGFVKMLNIDAIPESNDAIVRRQEREERVKKIKEEINDFKEIINRYNNYTKAYKELLACSTNRGDIDYYKREIKSNNKWIRFYKQKINELKFLL